MRNSYRIVVLLFISFGLAEVVLSMTSGMSRVERLVMLTASLFVVGLAGFGYGLLAGHPGGKSTAAP